MTCIQSSPSISNTQISLSDEYEGEKTKRKEKDKGEEGDLRAMTQLDPWINVGQVTLVLSRWCDADGVGCRWLWLG